MLQLNQVCLLMTSLAHSNWYLLRFSAVPFRRDGLDPSLFVVQLFILVLLAAPGLIFVLQL